MECLWAAVRRPLPTVLRDEDLYCVRLVDAVVQPHDRVVSASEGEDPEEGHRRRPFWRVQGDSTATRSPASITLPS